MMPRFFSPIVTARLFDPMPLPKRMKRHKIGKSHVQLPKTSRYMAPVFKIKKIPYNR